MGKKVYVVRACSSLHSILEWYNSNSRLKKQWTEEKEQKRRERNEIYSMETIKKRQNMLLWKNASIFYRLKKVLFIVNASQLTSMWTDWTTSKKKKISNTSFKCEQHVHKVPSGLTSIENIFVFLIIVIHVSRTWHSFLLFMTKRPLINRLKLHVFSTPK